MKGKTMGFLVLSVFILSLSLALAAPEGWAPHTGIVFAQESVCINCHRQVTPGIVSQFLSGKMGQPGAGLDCSTCHGSAHVKGAEDAKLAEMPTPETCKSCHPERFEQFSQGKHALAWVAMEAMPMWAHQPSAVVGTGFKGCSGCHKIGLKLGGYSQIKEFRYGTGSCDSCHTRHTFSVEEARDPRACQTCHMGFDHPQWEMWSTSKHGTIWAIEHERDGEGGRRGRAPTCQTCHMPEGNHAVMTSWGFLALRLPEEDAEWMANRATILQALGVLDWQGNPTARLDVVKAGKVARLTKEEFQAEREKMLAVCSQCHSPSYAKANLDAGDEIIKEADQMMAEAIREVKALYDEGLLKKPADWAFAPDLLQFYEAKSAIEQELWVMFLEHRMRTFQGAFHMNPDYMHWYGWAPMKESLARIKEEAERMRKAKESDT